ncbi:LON peptidase substrate-binding domain-containing protein [Sinisalibacter aestuarii]|uniref:ATP-dependent protease n=1 Tax=Sinisalibacter aestuarii TaxID=2949426 RepID=A0ABQ5LML5_9RHOB|nr:LON peptidase substrate-binding domain-containing protein [Sinisalibacter aestuarii]GKY86270.1 ATP-dependent protease [Sinisalibacter aestuarii]
MAVRADLPARLPLFPLPGALMLPRARLPLHIFEPRYLAMLEDVLKTPGRLIGMIQPADDAGERLHQIGCAGRVTSFTETEDHRYMITLTGISRFRVGTPEDGFTPYLVAPVNWDGFERDLGPSETDPGFNRKPFLKLLARYFDVTDLRTDWESLDEADDELLVNSLAILLPFSTEDKQALLEAPSLTTRRETLVALMEFELASQSSGGTEDKMQ